MSLKHYVEFYFPGILVMETSVQEIKDRKEVFKIPSGAYGYRFFDKEEVTVKGEVLKGKRKNWSGTYFFGEVMSLEDVREQRLSIWGSKTLIGNMEGNNWSHVVRTNRGNFQPFEKGDILIK